MSDIKQLRKRIDEIDEQILQSLSERAKICKAIGAAKKKQKMPIKDVERENAVYNRTRERAAELALEPDQVEAVYREIVNMCSAVQKVNE